MTGRSRLHRLGRAVRCNLRQGRSVLGTNTIEVTPEEDYHGRQDERARYASARPSPANCVACFRHYHGEALRIGLDRRRSMPAVTLGAKVKTGANIAVMNAVAQAGHQGGAAGRLVRRVRRARSLVLHPAGLIAHGLLGDLRPLLRGGCAGYAASMLRDDSAG